MIWRRRGLVCTLVALLTVAIAPGAAVAAKKPKPPKKPPAPPTAFDYSAQADKLTQPQYETEREVIRLPAFDGELLYIEVVKPTAEGRWPTILEASPYHGTLADRDGTRIFPGPKNSDGDPIGLTGYFAPRGYAVVMMDLRGTGRSQGCLNHLGSKDATDLEQVVEWAASQDWSNGRVGMTGHSYVGSTPSVAAAQNPDGLETIVPSAGLASMYHHQFQAGVPFFLQWTGVQWSYNYLTVAASLPPVGAEPVQNANTGDDFGNNMEETGCGAPDSALTAGEDQFSGRYADWHLQRDWNDEVTDADIPVFGVHGINDNAARVGALEWFFERRNPQDKLWLGQWDHGSPCCPTQSRAAVDLRASRLVRQAACAARREHGAADRAVPVRRPVVQQGSYGGANGDPHLVELADRRRLAHVLPGRGRRHEPARPRRRRGRSRSSGRPRASPSSSRAIRRGRPASASRRRRSSRTW